MPFESHSDRNDRLDREALEALDNMAAHGSAVFLNDDQAVRAMRQQKWLMQCDNCGEVFDDIAVSVGHDGKGDDDEPCWVIEGTLARIRPRMSLVLEEEAF